MAQQDGAFNKLRHRDHSKGSEKADGIDTAQRNAACCAGQDAAEAADADERRGNGPA